MLQYRPTEDQIQHYLSDVDRLISEREDIDRPVEKKFTPSGKPYFVAGDGEIVIPHADGGTCTFFASPARLAAVELAEEYGVPLERDDEDAEELVRELDQDLAPQEDFDYDWRLAKLGPVDDDE